MGGAKRISSGGGDGRGLEDGAVALEGAEEGGEGAEVNLDIRGYTGCQMFWEDGGCKLGVGVLAKEGEFGVKAGA